MEMESNWGSQSLQTPVSLAFENKLRNAIRLWFIVKNMKAMFNRLVVIEFAGVDEIGTYEN